MTTLEEVLDEAKCRCSGRSSPRSMYSQEMIFWTNLAGSDGIPGMLMFILLVPGTDEVTLVLASGMEVGGGGNDGKVRDRFGPELAVDVDEMGGKARAVMMDEFGGECRDTV